MDDKELLKRAAKAAGLKWLEPTSDGMPWNPLTDDGDSLRLAMRLGLVINCRHSQALAETNDEQFWELHDNGEDAATRRAIVRAAASMAPN